MEKQELLKGLANAPKTITIEDGAQFWVYISPANNTEEVLTKWSVTLEHTTSNWSGCITSDNPTDILQTPGLSGIFNVKAKAAGVKFAEKDLSPLDEPQIGCNSNCMAMVKLVANEDGSDANYAPTWNALCKE